MTKHKRWSRKSKRVEQSQRMSASMNKRWALVATDSRKRQEEMLWRTPHADHPLVAWRTSESVCLTQGMLSERLNVSEVTISNWESGRTKPRGKNIIKLQKLAEEIKVPLSMEWVNGPQIDAMASSCPS